MNGLVKVIDGKAVVTSKEVSDKFGRVHRNVMRDIERLDCSDEFRMLNFEQSTYVSLQGKVLPSYNMTRDGFSFLCMGFTGKKSAHWKEAYIKAFNEMERLLLDGGGSMMQSLNEAIRLMEQDKKVASSCGSGLNKWKEVRKDHMAKIDKLHNDVQLLLNFKGVEESE